MDVPTFLQDFPEFATYPVGQVAFYFNLATIRLDAATWGALWAPGVELFTAHYLSVASQRAKQAAAGQAPGANSGVVAAKSIKDLSVSYDAQLAAIDGAGHWNLTTYGLQLYELMRLVGVGAVQITGFSVAPGFAFGSLYG